MSENQRTFIKLSSGWKNCNIIEVFRNEKRLLDEILVGCD